MERENQSMLPGLRKILSNLNGVTIATMPKKRKGTLSRAVKEVRDGKVTKANCVADLISNLDE